MSGAIRLPFNSFSWEVVFIQYMLPFFTSNRHPVVLSFVDDLPLDSKEGDCNYSHGHNYSQLYKKPVANLLAMSLI